MSNQAALLACTGTLALALLTGPFQKQAGQKQATTIDSLQTEVRALQKRVAAHEQRLTALEGGAERADAPAAAVAGPTIDARVTKVKFEPDNVDRTSGQTLLTIAFQMDTLERTAQRVEGQFEFLDGAREVRFAVPVTLEGPIAKGARVEHDSLAVPYKSGRPDSEWLRKKSAEDLRVRLRIANVTYAK